MLIRPYLSHCLQFNNINLKFRLENDGERWHRNFSLSVMETGSSCRRDHAIQATVNLYVALRVTVKLYDIRLMGVGRRRAHTSTDPGICLISLLHHFEAELLVVYFRHGSRYHCITWSLIGYLEDRIHDIE